MSMDLSSEVYLSKPVVECKSEEAANIENNNTDDATSEVRNDQSRLPSEHAGTNGTHVYPPTTNDSSKPTDQQMMYHNGYSQMEYYGAAPTADAYIAAGYDPTTAAYYASQGWMYSALVDPNVSANASTVQDAIPSQNGYTGCESATEQSMNVEEESGSSEEKSSSGRLGLSSVPGLDELWAQVSTDFTDFDSWVKLLQKSETCDDVSEVVQAYDVFLERYPLCFGYWKKYSDILKKRNRSNEDILKVFERGVKAIPQSVDLWIHFSNFSLSNVYSQKTEEHVRSLREVLERGIAACGYEYKSDKLWDLYLKWEKENGDLLRVTQLYDKLFTVPTHNHAQHFEKFKEHVNQNQPKELVTHEEMLEMCKTVPKNELMANDVTTLPGDEIGSTDEDSSSSDDVKVPSVLPESVATKFKSLIVEKRQEAFVSLKEEIEKISPFEDAIRRNYFHVKPLERVQLNAWKNYLISMTEREKSGDVSEARVMFLFERCVITCCYYEEYWLKFVSYLEEKGMIEKAQHVFSLACRTHLPKKISLHIAWAKFEEKHGFRENAIKVLCDLENMHPEVVSIPMMKYGIYRRMWSLSKAGEAIQTARNNVQSRDNYVYLTMKLARFRAKVEGNFNAAYEVLQEALKKYPVNERLHTCLVDLEYSGRQVVNVKSFCEVCDNVIDNSQMSMNCRLKFCQRKLEMLEDFGSELSEIENTRLQYDRLCKEQNGDLDVSSGEPPEKKSRVTSTASSGVTISAAPNVTSAATSTTPQTSTASTSSSADPSGAQYGGYYYPWSYYGSQPYQQQYWPSQTAATDVPASTQASTVTSTTLVPPLPSSSVAS